MPHIGCSEAPPTCSKPKCAKRKKISEASLYIGACIPCLHWDLWIGISALCPDVLDEALTGWMGAGGTEDNIFADGCHIEQFDLRPESRALSHFQMLAQSPKAAYEPVLFQPQVSACAECLC